MPYPLIIAYKLGLISLFDHFSASPLGGDASQLYPMHMKHNGATRTLLRLIDGVFPNLAYIQCKLLWRLTQSGRYSAPALPTTTALPQNVPLSPPVMLIASQYGGRSGWQLSMMNGGGGRCTIVNIKMGADHWSKTSPPGIRCAPAYSITNEPLCQD
jgi:hypothetical protein